VAVTAKVHARRGCGVAKRPGARRQPQKHQRETGTMQKLLHLRLPLVVFAILSYLTLSKQRNNNEVL
jgi:hypothetical protein